jgi:hypothetical protein
VEAIHSIEYQLTSVLAAEIRHKLLRWELRRGWRRDLQLYVGTLLFAALIIGLGLHGWILPGVGGGLLCVLTLFAFGAVVRRRSHAYVAVGMALLAQQTHDRSVRVEFDDERVRLEWSISAVKEPGRSWTRLSSLTAFGLYNSPTAVVLWFRVRWFRRSWKSFSALRRALLWPTCARGERKCDHLPKDRS